jgi:membrane protein YqaA with SNARE-associated domain
VGLRLAAAFWAFAEATLFFIVPDVLLSLAVVARGWRAALDASLWATVGALLGGVAMYLWGEADLQGAVTALHLIPAISQGMVAQAQQDLAEQGFIALFRAGVTGVPYKIFAAGAPNAGIDLVPFLLASAAARLGRFLLAVTGAAMINGLLARRLTRRSRLALIAGSWVLFYALYWSLSSS